MITLEQIVEYIKNSRLERDSDNVIEVAGSTLEEAIKHASIEFGNVDSSKLEYEIIERGKKGFFGVGAKKWIIKVYLSQLKDMETEVKKIMHFTKTGEKIEIKNGKFYCHIAKKGYMLKVSPPDSLGEPVTFEDVIRGIRPKLEINDIKPDEKIIKKIIQNSYDTFVCIAKLEDLKQENNSYFEVFLSEDKMTGYINIKPPKKGGIDVEYSNILNALKLNGFKKGIKEEFIKELTENPIYNQNIIIAEGRSAVNGDDKKVLYNFKTESKLAFKESENRKIDFKELNKINNVVKDAIIAKIIPPKKGIPGFTITGEELPAKDGENKEIQIGKNVFISENGKEIVAAINGQIVLKNDIVSVEPIFVVEKSVDISIGNIFFLGSVVVKGNVEDGFSIKASGNIEVYGYALKCKLESEGDIIIRQGMSGKKEEVEIKAGKNLYSKFIENASVEAKGDVFVSDGIINSNVISYKRIVCKGKRATIVGGRVVGEQGIYVKNVGSVAGVHTLIETGYEFEDVKAIAEKKQELEEIKIAIKEKEDDYKNTTESAFMNTGIDKTYVANKLKKLKRELNKFSSIAKNLENEIATIEDDMNTFADNSKISVEGFLYSGVKIIFKNKEYFVKSDQKSVTVKLKNGEIAISGYERMEENT